MLLGKKMRAKLSILDCQNHYIEISLGKKHNEYRCTSLDSTSEAHIAALSSVQTNSIVVDVHPIQLHYLLKELEHWHHLRRRIVRFLRHLDKIVVLKVIPIDKGVLDLEWCRRAISLTWRKVEEENLMSWLSTLGGAFSALGDNFEKCADTAGKISMYQLKIATESGDPAIVARCKLYYSISLIQKGRLRAAKHLVRAQYALAKSDEFAADDRLFKMCHGIWLKLQHAYYLRQQARFANGEHK